MEIVEHLGGGLRSKSFPRNIAVDLLTPFLRNFAATTDEAQIGLDSLKEPDRDVRCPLVFGLVPLSNLEEFVG